MEGILEERRDRGVSKRKEQRGQKREKERVRTEQIIVGERAGKVRG